MMSRWTGGTQIVDKHGRVEPEAQETDGLEHGMQIQGVGGLVSDVGPGDRDTQGKTSAAGTEESDISCLTGVLGTGGDGNSCGLTRAVRTKGKTN